MFNIFTCRELYSSGSPENISAVIELSKKVGLNETEQNKQYSRERIDT